MPPSIYDYIKSEEARFETEEVSIGDNWDWNFRKHVQMIFHLKNGQFFTGTNDWLRAFKNIMEPILNLAYWMEDIELKDIFFYIDGKDDRALSFLIKKYHEEVYSRENDLDTMLDEITENDIDYGGVLIQETNDPKPEVISFNSIAFCDQTDILGGVVGFKYHFSPSKLREMSNRGWGEEKNGANISIEDLIVLATSEKDVDGTINLKKNQSTSKNIDVYVVRGNLPNHYLKDNNDMEYFCYQIQIVGFYTDKDSKMQGVCLYRKQEKPDRLMFHTSKKVHGRALGRGTGESLLHPQIWTNFLTIHKMNMLEAASKVPLYTDDTTYTQKNKIQDMENLEITTIEDGKRIFQVPTAAPANLQLIEVSINDWYAQAQLTGSAFDPVLGEQPVSGTTFRGQNQIVQQGRGLHERRRGQRAKFIELIYRKIIIPKMVKEIFNGKKFLATLNGDELAWISEQVATNLTNKYITDKLLNKGQFITEEEKASVHQKIKSDFSKKGNKHLLEILKDEFRDVEVRIGINVANKQRDLASLSDKVLSIFQFAFQDPQRFQATLQIPGMGKTFNDLLEYSGISQIDFATVANIPLQPQNTQQITQQNPQNPLVQKLIQSPLMPNTKPQVTA